MAKGSVRKKGKKWYYRFYVEDASGNLVQKECVGTESKSGTEKLLRQAMDDYEKKKFVAKAENLTVGQLLDVWAEEELKTGTLSNGTVENYLGTIRNIKKHPLAERKLKNVTSEHLQSFFDLLSFGGVHPDGKERKGYSKDYIHSFSAVMQQSFRFAVFPKQYITFNPMQYIKLRYQTDEVDLFSDEDMDGNIQPISREDYERLLAYLKKKDKIRKIIVYSLAVLFLLGSIQVHVPSGNPQWMLSEKETVLTSFSEDMKLVDCKKEENENGPFNEGKEENRQSQDGERLLYYLALGEFLMFLGTLLSGTGQIEKFSRKYLERMVYVIRYMQDMDGRKKYHFCYE